MPLLVVEKGPDKGKSIPLVAGGTVLIGRDSSTTLPLRDTMASRMHFKIQAREDGFYLTDLESMNGTYVNGERVREEIRLEIGDLVKVGESLFTFTSEENYSTTLSGQRMGGYRIIERVGRGGMGTVYKAEQVDLQRIVALKVISDEHTKDKEFVELFIHEARAAAKLNHPNIVQVYDVKRHNDHYYFSMEYVSAGSVQEILNKQRKTPWSRTVEMLLDAARGLDYAHKKGIIHRDIKPDNLMISESGMVKIGDMGLARGLEEKIGPEEETSVIGTPHYIAPEQVLGRPADFRSDIYSLGATAYRMLTGITPFNAPSVRDLVNKKVREDASAIQDHTPDVPKALCDIIVRMMVRDPDRRYQTMGEVVRDLERFQRGHTTVGEDGHHEASRPVAKLVAGRGTLIGAAAAALLLAGGVAFFILSGSSDGDDPGPVPSPVVDPRAADQALFLATRAETGRMDVKDPRSIERVLADYGAVMDKFPGTAAATKAAERRAILEKTLRESRVQKRLELAEADEIGQYRRLTQGFSAARPDWSPADAAEAAYAAVAAAAESKGAPAGAEATARAAHIRLWRETVQGRKEAYDKALQRSQASVKGERYRDAWESLVAFRDETRQMETDCPFAKDRWKDLFFDEAVASELLKTASEARVAWARQEEEARLMARDKNYEGAIKLLESVMGSSVQEVMTKAREVKDGLELEWAAMTRREEEERETALAAARTKARTVYGQESLAARELVLKYDFKGALARMKSLKDLPAAEEFKPRVDRRVAELERAAQFKETLVNVIRAKDVSSGTNPYKFKTDYLSQGLEGVIDDGDDRSMKIKLSVGGTIEHLWTQFDPAAFHEFVRKQWKYSREQRRDANDQCNLAAFCMEFGLYEKALEEIKVVLDAMDDPQYTVADSVRRFCEEYRTRLTRGESAEYSEIEAQKRLARLEAFMAAVETYPQARKEIDILRAVHGRTAAVAGAAAKIQEHLQKINKSGDEGLNRQLRDDRHKAMLAKVAEEQAAARGAKVDIVARLLRLDDAFERALHLGSVYAAAGEWRASSEKYGEARKLGDQQMNGGKLPHDSWPLLGHIYGELIRNSILLKDKKAVEIRNDGARRFVSPDTQAPEEWWVTLSGWLDTWGEKVYPVEEKKLPRLREDVKAAPEDPVRIWALAQSLAEGVQSLSEARGYLLWLIENHPDFTQVQNGNCLHRLAEILWASREVREAVRRYLELGSQHKDHPKVLEAGTGGVRKRLDEAYKLLNRMGYKVK